jgi:hypothetical protein
LAVSADFNGAGAAGVARLLEAVPEVPGKSGMLVSFGGVKVSGEAVGELVGLSWEFQKEPEPLGNPELEVKPWLGERPALGWKVAPGELPSPGSETSTSNSDSVASIFCNSGGNSVWEPLMAM